MSDRFKQFVEEKIQQDESVPLTFRYESENFGTKTITFREPPSVYAMLDVMSGFLGKGVSKKEIIYEAIHSAFADLLDSIDQDTMAQLQDEYDEAFQRHLAIVLPESGPGLAQGLSVDAQTKADAQAKQNQNEEA